VPQIETVAVFCGSRPGRLPGYRDAAAALGTGLAEAGLRLVYGGGRIGLMGALADAALAGGGTVIGIIPEFLTRLEVAHDGVTELVVTDSMHVRKRRMFELADAFVTLPGGLGTLDETVEILTWRQLGLHAKPVLLCDVAGSSEPLVATIEAAIDRGFAGPESRRLYEVVPGVPGVLRRLAQLAETSGQPATPGGAAALT
jgi:uncharacterized protein (TIGR00730 family)